MVQPRHVKRPSTSPVTAIELPPTTPMTTTIHIIATGDGPTIAHTASNPAPLPPPPPRLSALWRTRGRVW